MDAEISQYLKDVENDSNATYAMRKIAEYYLKNKDYENMKKYYLMALENGSSIAMICLAEYYKDTEKNYKLMKKYYRMAIEKGHSNAMYSLGYHYHNTEKNYELMEKYYLMAIKKGHQDAINSLNHYYNNIEYKYESSKNPSDSIKPIIFKKDIILDCIPLVSENVPKLIVSQDNTELNVKEILNKKNTICDRCYDTYVEPSIAISCQHKNICHYCTIKLKTCPNCGAKYC
jgi:TPR repeat protein